MDIPLVRTVTLPPPHVAGKRLTKRPYAFLLESVCAHPLDVFLPLLRRYVIPSGVCPVPFSGGAVGYLSYDLGRTIEPVSQGKRQPPDNSPAPDVMLAFYDVVAAWDNHTGLAYLISTGFPETTNEAQAARSTQRVEEIQRLLGSTEIECQPRGSSSQAACFESGVTKAGYLAMVERAKGYIAAGDIYQVNLAQQFRAPWTDGPWQLYERLRRINPAPFAAVLDFPDAAIVSASPERFLRIADGIIETRPIKGTRPRGKTTVEDASLAQELLASGKDRAEHIMIVDLERNDLGRVAEIGSVTVDELMALEMYATVHHLTSTVRGRLRQDVALADVLKATFPGGSITGAPKIRAMQIIDELEPVRRGVYTGAIGYFGFDGRVDLNIAIRTAVLRDGIASVHVGGGIVHDSDPAAEYQETLDKGEAFFRALRSAPL
ncbi:MAG: aminodeoxychorismate synthase component I [Chloroflexi bacterium]|nr:aminodeoxychorismate synthase component I [Chloroflexota bacterium]